MSASEQLQRAGRNFYVNFRVSVTEPSFQFVSVHEKDGLCVFFSISFPVAISAIRVTDRDSECPPKIFFCSNHLLVLQFLSRLQSLFRYSICVTATGLGILR